MCGFAGVASRSGPVAAAPSELGDRLGSALAHRGPDGAGSWLSPSSDVLLVHRRLAIIDLTPSGSQPMRTPDGSGTLVFNGEVYNHREIRASLSSRGERFASSSDTEVLLRLLACDGPGALSRVRGMFALAYWDDRSRSLLLARDRFGIKPLYVTAAEDRLAFASELGALVRAGVVEREVSAAGVLAYLSWGSVPSPLTWHAKVEMLQPGAWRRWWFDGREDGGRFADSRTPYRSDRRQPQSREQFRRTIGGAVRDSVRAHLIADVPVGVFLSGGVDSSALVSAAVSAGATNLQTFTVGFDDPTSEAGFARTVAQVFGTAHHELRLDAPSVETDWPRILAHLDQPTIDAVNSFYVSKTVAATGIKAVLSGVGGDELFCGYPSFERLPRALAAKRALGPLFPVFAPVASMVLPRRLKPRWRHFSSANGHLAEAYRVQRGFLLPQEIRNLAGPRLLDQASSDVRDRLREVEEMVCAPVSAAAGEETAAGIARLETRLYLGSQLLRDIDAMSMAHGLEVRVPLVDHELVDRVWPELGFHADLRLGKRLLFESLERPLPAFVPGRRKQGFTLPIGRWMESTLRPLVTDGLTRLATDGWLAADAPDRVWSAWRAGDTHWTRPWGLAVLGHFLGTRGQ